MEDCGISILQIFGRGLRVRCIIRNILNINIYTHRYCGFNLMGCSVLVCHNNLNIKETGCLRINL